MAILYQDAKLLLEAKVSGVSFATTLTVAHLTLRLHPREVRALRRAYSTPRESPSNALTTYEFGDYSDGFLRDFLGVDSLCTMDSSTYEGATMVHDLNRPVTESLRCMFDVVIDCGSLEHIFNVSTALSNLMTMLKVGGSIFITTPANNLCGHGFYQFSPELMFRVFSHDNGFQLQQLILCEAVFPSVELSVNGDMYRVVDPATVNSRVMLVTRTPVLMMVQAKKVRDVLLFSDAPQQSDYQTAWREDAQTTVHSRAGRIARSVLTRLPFIIRSRLIGYAEVRRFSFANRRFYSRVS